MPRAEAIFTVVSPDAAGDGPAFATADALFIDSRVPPQERLLEMPTEVDGVPLVTGMILRGKGHIFVASALEVRPHELRILPLTADSKLNGGA